MGSIRWIGNAIPVTQVWSLTITVNDPATTYAVVINGKWVNVAGNGSGSAVTAANLAAALAASTIAEFQEVTWTASAASVFGTGKTPGKPFIAGASATHGSGAVGSVGDTTPCTGPNFLDNPANWDAGSLPVSGDDVYVDNGAIDVLYNLGNLAGVSFNSFNIAASFTGNIGLLQNTGKYHEYRGIALAIAAARLNIGYGPGSGSPRLRIDDLAAGAVSITVSNTGASNEPGLPALCLLGFTSNTSIQVLRGSVGIGLASGILPDVQLLEVGYVTNVQGDAQVLVGPNCGVISSVIAGGATVFQGSNNLGSVQISGGTFSVYGTGSCGQFTITGGTLYWNSIGTLGESANYISGKGTLDLSQDMQTKPFISGGVIYAAKGATINDPSNVLVAASGSITIEPQGCSMSDLNLDFGYGRRVQV